MSVEVVFVGAEDGDDGPFDLASTSAWEDFSSKVLDLPRPRYIALHRLVRNGSVQNTKRLAEELDDVPFDSGIALLLRELVGVGDEEEHAAVGDGLEIEDTKEALTANSVFLKAVLNSEGDNCGVGPGGFQPGNTCGKGRGGRSATVDLDSLKADMVKELEAAGLKDAGAVAERLLSKYQPKEPVAKPASTKVDVKAAVTKLTDITKEADALKEKASTAEFQSKVDEVLKDMSVKEAVAAARELTSYPVKSRKEAAERIFRHVMRTRRAVESIQF